MIGMRTFVLMITLALQVIAFGGVVWEKKTVSRKGKLFTEEPILYTFSGTNTGRERKIASIRSHCPCVRIIDYPKEVVGDGKTFDVMAALTPSHFGGKQRYYISVVYSGQKEKPERLVLECAMPSLVTFSTNHLYWKKGSKPEAREIKLKLGLTLAEVYAMDENFTSRRTVIDGRTLVVEVAPRNTGITRPAALMLKFKTGDKELKKLIPLFIAEKDPFLPLPRSFTSNRPARPDYRQLSKSLRAQATRKRTKIPPKTKSPGDSEEK